jgi:hypothetical protein
MDKKDIFKYWGIDKIERAVEIKVERYLERVEQLRKHPDIIIIAEGVDGITWVWKNSPEGRAYLRELENRENQAEIERQLKENPVETVVDNLLDRDHVSKIEIRQELDKLGKFTVDNLAAVVACLNDEGITIK